ncbi:MAG: hypothetical protein AAB263_05985 [Planctomycetota bacterium]
MYTLYPTFPERLDAAIENLSPARVRSLESRFSRAAGIRSMIVEACEMPHVSALSDILSGRVPGTKYRKQLASVLGVELSWLEGLNDVAPEDVPAWAFPPLEAWRRFALRLRERSDARDEDESADPNARDKFRSRAATLAKAYRVDVDGPLIQALLHARYTEVPFNVVIAYARQVGLPSPTHPEHLKAGHAMWVCVNDELKREVEVVRKRFHRYIPPAKLFAALRKAVVDPTNGLTMIARADAMEMLWRQQWLLADRSRSSVPETFARDTSRQRWSKLDTIRERWDETA